MKENLKHMAKRAVRRARLLLLGLSFTRTNKADWQKRMLLINLDAIGGIVVSTSVLKHYKRLFPEKKIFLLLSGTNGISPSLVNGYVDQIIFIDTKKFNMDPRYGYHFVKKLRHIGFATVVEHNPHLELAGKIIATELGAEKIIGYEGVRIDIERPITPGYARGYSYIKKKILPRYTDIVKNTTERRKKTPDAEYIPNIINDYIKIFEFITNAPQSDYAPQLTAEKYALPAGICHTLKKYGIKENIYCLLSLTASAPCKEWEMKKFADVCNYLAEKKIPVVLVGTKKDAERIKDFSQLLQHPVINLTGMTNIMDVVLLAKNCLFTLSNETSIGHIAIALKKPSVTIAAAWNLGMWTFYGYEDINKWVYQKNAPCMGDNGQCITDRNLHAPCLSAIKSNEVKVKISTLLQYLNATPAHPQKSFALDFGK